MVFVKIQKTKTYFSRYQVKYRRRRQCKTDYRARRRMITQYKNKYNTPKYRFVVRFTNKDIIAQIFSAGLTHDTCLAHAYAHELPRYGVKVGLTNYAAAYCTGLLLARRVEAKYRLAYDGTREVNGSEFHVKNHGQGMAPFKADLDTGLARTVTGARIWGALKGAADGGLNIPHNAKRFPGSKKVAEEGKAWEADPETHRKYIFGGHVAEYMKLLESENPEKYKTHFAEFIKAGINADGLEKMYKAAHQAIRKQPNKPRNPIEKGYFKVRAAPRSGKFPENKQKSFKRAPLTVQQRKDIIKQKVLSMRKRAAAAPKKEEETDQ